MLDITLLQYSWWILMLVLLIGFSITDGFDMGVAILLPFAAKTDLERRVIINTIGATWEGNQVWLITFIAALFAAFPKVYATSFSSLYIVLMLTLFCLFLRPVGFDYRSKLTNSTWRKYWDIGLFIGGFIPCFIFGIAVGNVFLGIPFKFTAWQLPINKTNFFALLNPFALLIGLMGVSLFSLHGATWLNLKTSGVIQQRARNFAKYLAFLFIFLWIIGGFSLQFIDGFMLTKAANVIKQKGLWLQAFKNNTWLYSIIFTAIVCVILNIKLQKNYAKLSWWLSVLTIILFFINTACALFPFMLPSNLNIQHSLTAFNASSSYKTLVSMFIAVCIFMPLILAYTAWVYKVLKGKVEEKNIENPNSKSYWY